MITSQHDAVSQLWKTTKSLCPNQHTPLIFLSHSQRPFLELSVKGNKKKTERKKEMLLSLVHTSSFTSPFESKNYANNLNPTTLLLPNSFIPDFQTEVPTNALKRLLCLSSKRGSHGKRAITTTTTHASLLEAPVLWAGRLCIFYALLKAGLAGSQSNPIFSELESGDGGAGDLGFSQWLENIQGKPVNEAADKRKLVSKWHPTTKGTLRRNYRVPSKSEGRHLLKAIASLLSDDDHFTDATSHKGCQIRRETAHGESVCCNNVRALFDELPTPHLTVEITPFPAGPLTEKDYTKAEKLERVLRSGPSI